MTDVAEDRAVHMYTSGRISRDTPPGGNVADDLAAAGLRLQGSGENLALASSSRAAFAGMTESATGNALLSTSGFDRVGISVLDGPTGTFLVIVFGA